MDACDSNACHDITTDVVSFLDGTSKPDEHHCNLVSRLFGKSPYGGDNYIGYRDYFM